ncbi:MAG: trigger factor, partial [Candidatus Doudnabacteria bacterium]|nr:trigger factor [Candidatus Doudnabacteria bacterium]
DKIFEEALDTMINNSLIKAIQLEDVYPYGDPDLKVDKVTPLEEVTYTVTMTAFPEVTLGEWPKEKIKKNIPEITKEEIEKSLKDLTKMLVREELADRPAKTGDSTVVDFDVLVNGVPIEGGSAKDFSLIVGEGKMIPGFEEQLVGMKAGDVKDFKLKFPADYKADLAGKQADFKIALKQVLDRFEPEINDELAKRLGVASKDELYKRMEDNLKSEKNEKEQQRSEIEAIKKLLDVSKIAEIPEKMIKDETHRLVHEFEHDLAKQGADMQTYLSNINKKAEDLEKEFEPKAIDRIKTSLIIDAVAEKENLKITEKEVEFELAKQKQFYAKQPDVLKQLTTQDYKRHLHTRMLKVKAIDIITANLIE